MKWQKYVTNCAVVGLKQTSPIKQLTYSEPQKAGGLLLFVLSLHIQVVYTCFKKVSETVLNSVFFFLSGYVSCDGVTQALSFCDLIKTLDCFSLVN